MVTFRLRAVRDADLMQMQLQRPTSDAVLASDLLA